MHSLWASHAPQLRSTVLAWEASPAPLAMPTPVAAMLRLQGFIHMRWRWELLAEEKRGPWSELMLEQLCL